MYVRQREDGVTLRVRVVPNASKNTVSLEREDSLTVRITAPPVEGKANKHLLKFLGKLLGLPQSSLSILLGLTSREKIVLVRGMDEVTMRKIIDANTNALSKR
ncbi:MAG TPA: DUF167 family protein [Desulfomonilaceae bacterium]|nr:DUF167 family protein [Desulfomonilaceae bacterium]